MKNDVTIKGAGVEYTLRPSFQCLINVESRAKKSLLKIIEEFQAGHGTLSDMICILKEGSRAAGAIMTDAQIETLIEEEGLVSVQIQLAQFFVKGMYGGKAHEAQSPKTEAEGTESLAKSHGTNSLESQSLN
jgi:hypothetical protein